MVIVLDTSGSMATGAQAPDGQQLPPNDPGRAAVLGALVVEGLSRGSDDKVTVIGFGDGPTAVPQVGLTADQIREMQYVSGTWFRGAFQDARRRLEASAREQKLALIFSDGAPSDGLAPAEAIDLLGLKEHPEIDTLVMGLFGGDDSRQEGLRFLTPLPRSPEALVTLDSRDGEIASRIVAEFTKAYAAVLGSRPESGVLSAGGSLEIPVPRYVTEVMVVTASVAPGPAYDARLENPAGPLAPRADGDNGCGLGQPRIKDVCEPPFRHYRVFRDQHDPAVVDTWRLSLPSASGPVAYGIILRYDLVATVAVPSQVPVSEPVTVEANLLFRGQVFDDASFFESDGFQAEAKVGNEVVPLTHVGGGVFRGVWIPMEPTGDEALAAEVTFKNLWMSKRVRRSITVEGALAFNLVADPNPLELGVWRGDRGATERCGILDLSRSAYADRIAVACEPQDVPPGLVVTCTPVVGSEAILGSRKGQPMQWQVCAAAEACCGALPGSTAPSVRLAGQSPSYSGTSVTVPVRLQVEQTGWLLCWWVEIAIILAALGVLFLVMGWIRPHDFDPSAAVKLAGSEAGLRRSSALILAEMPKGRRGFYRSARICLDGEGNPLRRPAGSVLVLEAAASATTRFVKAAGLEKKNQRNGHWEPVSPEDLEAGYHPGAIYRIGGNLYLRFS